MLLCAVYVFKRFSTFLFVLLSNLHEKCFLTYPNFYKLCSFKSSTFALPMTLRIALSLKCSLTHMAPVLKDLTSLERIFKYTHTLHTETQEGILEQNSKAV